MTGALFLLALAATSPADQVGYSLADRWELAWLRMMDRTGLPDPSGPLQQRYARAFMEYDMDMGVSAFAMADERAWQQAITGGRLWAQSLDELTLANRVQLKTRAKMGDSAYLGLRFDRFETREIHSSLLQVEFGFERIAGSRAFLQLTMTPRWEKDDSDVQLRAGWDQPGFGRVAVRLVSFDTFVDASFALLESRGAIVEEHVDQLQRPLGFALELQSESWFGFRAELYAGMVPGAWVAYRYPNAPEDDHQRQRSGLLGGMLIAWHHPEQPIEAGITGFAFDTTMRRKYDSRTGDNNDHRETTYELGLYAISRPLPRLDLVVSALHRQRPEAVSWPNASGRNSERDDSGLHLAFRGSWMFGDVAGVELGLLRAERESTGLPQLWVDGTATRLTTRCVLRFEDVSARFGVGWDLDDGDGLYDGGGVTIVGVF